MTTLDDVAKKKAVELVLVVPDGRLAQEQGLSLTGHHGLLKQLTRTVSHQHDRENQDHRRDDRDGQVDSDAILHIGVQGPWSRPGSATEPISTCLEVPSRLHTI